MAKEDINHFMTDDPEQVEKYIKSVVLPNNSINLVDIHSYHTPITYACFHGNYEVARVLISNGANIEQYNASGDTALIVACRCGNISCVNLLLMHKADPNLLSTYETTPLIQAAVNDHADIVSLLIEYGVNINWQRTVSNGGSQTALTRASACGHLRTVRALLARHLDANIRGADLNIRGTNGWTAVMFAACHGHVDILRELLQAGCDADLADVTGKTALMKACRNRPECVQILLEYGANKELIDLEGRKAEDYCRDENTKEIIINYSSSGFYILK